MYQAPVARTPKEIAFKSAYSEQRRAQELRGVVCVTPEDVHARMQSLSSSQFEALLKHMVDSGFVCIHRGSVKPRILTWIE